MMQKFSNSFFMIFLYTIMSMKQKHFSIIISKEKEKRKMNNRKTRSMSHKIYDPLKEPAGSNISHWVQQIKLEKQNPRTIGIFNIRIHSKEKNRKCNQQKKYTNLKRCFLKWFHSATDCLWHCQSKLPEYKTLQPHFASIY